MTRYALVSGGLNVSLGLVQDYLPSNYSAEETDWGILIQGEDSHGWTMELYVLPRLGSALIAAREIVLLMEHERGPDDLPYREVG